MKRNRTGKGRWIAMAIAVPVLTIGLAGIAAKLMLSEVITESALEYAAAVIVGVVSFVTALVVAIAMPQKKLMWSMVTTAAYACALLLGNLLLFGVGYAGVGWIIGTVFGAGLLGGVIGSAKRQRHK